ncbi:hypothetical protein DFP72DRAFT_473596 [Ephemerocybe angulata]|uniref:Uncharacterized protein n=1 Tax=Ephemerocybe angulata TaxID=980116 RepID=A0A8H6HS76_9AGAR|nr:hypothetical protein DFP72DRAFT_473596 [Tulosesus angulatus]
MAWRVASRQKSPHQSPLECGVQCGSRCAVIRRHYLSSFLLPSSSSSSSSSSPPPGSAGRLDSAPASRAATAPEPLGAHHHRARLRHDGGHNGDARRMDAWVVVENDWLGSGGGCPCFLSRLALRYLFPCGSTSRQTLGTLLSIACCSFRPGTACPLPFSVGPCSLIIAYGHVFQALDLVGVVACGSPARSPRLQPPPLLAPNDAEALDRSTLACIDAEFISVCCPAPVKPTPTPTSWTAPPSVQALVMNGPFVQDVDLVVRSCGPIAHGLGVHQPDNCGDS